VVKLFGGKESRTEKERGLKKSHEKNGKDRSQKKGRGKRKGRGRSQDQVLKKGEEGDLDGKNDSKKKRRH